MALPICFSRLSLSLLPPHLCSSHGGRLSPSFPAPMAFHLKKNAALSNHFSGSTLSLGKNLPLLSIPTQKHSKLTVFAKKKGYKMKTRKVSYYISRSINSLLLILVNFCFFRKNFPYWFGKVGASFRIRWSMIFPQKKRGAVLRFVHYCKILYILVPVMKLSSRLVIPGSY
jgi:hypothetical protein